eukprot:4696746-Amphidinium_carterae.1
MNPLLEDLVRAKDFTLVSAYRFSKQDAHINEKEMLAARTAIRAAASDVSLHSTRLTVAIDSQVVVWLLRKGRSSSKKLNRLLKSCMAWMLSARLRLHPLWISTEGNPADDPTRGVPLRSAELPSDELVQALHRIPSSLPWAAEMTRLLWAPCRMSFDDTLGFPGEGPSLARKHIDLRLSVQPGTIRRYVTCVNRVREIRREWLALEGLPPLEELCNGSNGDSLSPILGAFVQYLHDSDAPYTHALEALAGVQFFHPNVQGSIHGAWKALRTWGQQKPIQVRSPMPLPILLALVTTALVMGWERTAGVLLLGFEALLRPSEMGGCLRGHLSLPGDLYGHPYCAILSLPETKTASRTVKLQSVLIKDAPLIEYLHGFFSCDGERSLLMPGGAAALQRKFLSLKEMIGIRTAPWTLASVRGGGCVHFALHSTDMDYLQWKGRWASQRSMRHYMQMGLGVASFSSLDATVKEKVMKLAALASPLLRHRASVNMSTRGNGGDAEISAGENYADSIRAEPLVCAADCKSLVLQQLTRAGENMST